MCIDVPKEFGGGDSGPVPGETLDPAPDRDGDRGSAGGVDRPAVRRQQPEGGGELDTGEVVGFECGHARLVAAAVGHLREEPRLGAGLLDVVEPVGDLVPRQPLRGRFRGLARPPCAFNGTERHVVFGDRPAVEARQGGAMRWQIVLGA